MELLIRHNRDSEGFPKHNRKCLSTVVLEKPDVREIMQELRKSFTPSYLKLPKIVVNIGGAFCYYKDQFNKKLGRELARSRLKPVEMYVEVQSFHLNSSDAIWLVLTGVDKELEVQYSVNIKVYRDSGQLRVFGCFTREWR